MQTFLNRLSTATKSSEKPATQTGPPAGYSVADTGVTPAGSLAQQGKAGLLGAISARQALVLALAVVVAVNLFLLMRTPSPFMDEAWNVSRAWSLLHTGMAYGSLDSGVFEKYAGYWTYFPWLGTAIHAVSVYLFGPTLFAVRIVSLFFGVVLLIAVYTIGARLYNEWVGIAAVLVLAFSKPFTVMAHLGRHDVIVSALGFGAIALYFTDSGRGFTLRSFLSGLAIGLTLDIHLNGLIFVPLVGVLYLYDYRLQLLASKRFWGFVLGFVAGATLYASLHLFSYQETYAALAAISGSWHTPPILSFDPAIMVQSLADTVLHWGLIIPVAAVSLMYLFARRSPSDKRVVLLFVTAVLVFASVVQIKQLWYDILLFPAVALMVAPVLVALLKEPWYGSPLRLGRTALIAGGLVGSVFISLLPTRLCPPSCTDQPVSVFENLTSDYASILDQVRETVPADHSVMGPQIYWFALPNERYLTWEQVFYYERSKPGSTVSDAMQALGLDYLILNGPPQWSPAELAALQQYLDKNTHLVTQIPTQQYGTVTIYKLNGQGH